MNSICLHLDFEVFAVLVSFCGIHELLFLETLTLFVSSCCIHEFWVVAGSFSCIRQAVVNSRNLHFAAGNSKIIQKAFPKVCLWLRWQLELRMIPRRPWTRQWRLLQAPFSVDLGNLVSVYDAKPLEELFLFF